MSRCTVFKLSVAFSLLQSEWGKHLRCLNYPPSRKPAHLKYTTDKRNKDKKFYTAEKQPIGSWHKGMPTLLTGEGLKPFQDLFLFICMSMAMVSQTGLLYFLKMSHQYLSSHMVFYYVTAPPHYQKMKSSSPPLNVGQPVPQV